MNISLWVPSRPILFSANLRNGSSSGSKWALPMSAVRYPAPRRVRAMLGASSGNGTPFIHTPWVATCWPVTMVLRDGMHTTFCGWART